MDLFTECNKNSTLLVLLAVVLVSGNGNGNGCSSLFSGNTPLLFAVGYYLYKNGAFNSLFASTTCSCNG